MKGRAGLLAVAVHQYDNTNRPVRVQQLYSLEAIVPRVSRYRYRY
jgi:hypothetical protein